MTSPAAHPTTAQSAAHQAGAERGLLLLMLVVAVLSLAGMFALGG